MKIRMSRAARSFLALGAMAELNTPARSFIGLASTYEKGKEDKMTDKLYTTSDIKNEFHIKDHQIYYVRAQLGIKPVSYMPPVGKSGKGGTSVHALYTREQVDQIIAYQLGIKERRQARGRELGLQSVERTKTRQSLDMTLAERDELLALLREALPLLRDIRAAILMSTTTPSAAMTPLKREDNGTIVHESGARLRPSGHLGSVR